MSKKHNAHGFTVKGWNWTRYRKYLEKQLSHVKRYKAKKKISVPKQFWLSSTVSRSTIQAQRVMQISLVKRAYGARSAGKRGWKKGVTEWLIIQDWCLVCNISILTLCFAHCDENVKALKTAGIGSQWYKTATAEREMRIWWSSLLACLLTVKKRITDWHLKIILQNHVCQH